ncbi:MULTISPECIES: hypothetical protein [Arthrobacter]|uniref:Uncharacterized protein n=1 Tax=Arthrobacter terricola TaxID=2547396 RepID=A0A4R5KPN1_9MICC|nr:MULTISPECIES: hypothetical protein [Arthrobacter]MBT8161039.1 hypothetical protein [Arthrobacter sp. GN70]TDF96898.1 hypothetical protein E1809_09255 [Arthrobacter terricola]
MGFQLSDDYITVGERIVEFRTKYPDGSLQPADLAKPYTFETINGNQSVVVVAAAYRTPEDTRPGIGMAYEPIPGATNFTRGSELQNAETAAWGRAIVAVLAADTKRGIASYEEVRVQQEREQPRASQTRSQGRAAPAVDEQVLADWKAAIDQAAGDRDALLKLYNDAQSQKAPKAILDRIKAEGNKAKPQ